MASTNSLQTLAAIEVLRLLTDDVITVEEYAHSLVKRITKRDATIKAWAHFGPEFVIQQTRNFDELQKEERGPLHGVALGIKDIINTKGKTITSEFAVTDSVPQTTNPCDPNRTPGGSSAGSTAAVADFQVPRSMGVQSGGSAIRPAPYTGIYAMKPSFNSISTAGQSVFSVTYDTIACFARSLEDFNLIANVFHIEDDQTPKNIPLKDISVGMMKTVMWSQAGPGTMSAMNNAGIILQKHGSRVEEVSLPEDIDDASIGEARVAFLPEYHTPAVAVGLHGPLLNIPVFVGDNGVPIRISLIVARNHGQHLLRVGQVLGELLTITQ
ncbi:amidase signature enzyme [Phaeosphaeriaceae sp. SRC1lsM3a]|nr:amidase signature enzyme [Stagonospora sp. SRC1lsM3a]